MRYPVLYVPWLPGPRIGLAIGPLCLIRRAYRDDAGLRAHEVAHARQFWRTLGLHVPLYLLCRRYRFYAEAEAYAAQTMGDRSRIEAMSERMARHGRELYRLDVTPGRCRRAIELYTR